MRHRARSLEAKQRRAEDLLNAAVSLAAELGGVRHVTLAAVTERAGLHPSAVRRYFASKEELLLELAERGWKTWREEVIAATAGRTGLTPHELAGVVVSSLTCAPLFCDLLTHVVLSLEGDVDLERARRYKATSFKAFDAIIAAIVAAGDLDAEQVGDLLTAALGMTANLWQVSHPTATLRRLYDEEPRWAHSALDFEPRLTRLLGATATGLTRDQARGVGPTVEQPSTPRRRPDMPSAPTSRSSPG